MPLSQKVRPAVTIFGPEIVRPVSAGSVVVVVVGSVVVVDVVVVPVVDVVVVPVVDVVVVPVVDVVVVPVVDVVVVPVVDVVAVVVVVGAPWQPGASQPPVPRAICAAGSVPCGPWQPSPASAVDFIP